MAKYRLLMCAGWIDIRWKKWRPDRLARICAWRRILGRLAADHSNKFVSLNSKMPTGNVEVVQAIDEYDFVCVFSFIARAERYSERPERLMRHCDSMALPAFKVNLFKVMASAEPACSGSRLRPGFTP